MILTSQQWLGIQIDHYFYSNFIKHKTMWTNQCICGVCVHCYSSTGDLRSIPTAGVNRGAGPGGGVSVSSQWKTSTQSGMEPRRRVSSMALTVYWCDIQRRTPVILILSSALSSPQGSVPRWRPSCRVSGRWPGAEGEVSQNEGPGALPVSGQQQRRNSDAPVQAHSARCQHTLTTTTNSLN